MHDDRPGPPGGPHLSAGTGTGGPVPPDAVPGPVVPTGEVFADDVVQTVEAVPVPARRAATRPPMGLVESRAELGGISLADTSLQEVVRRVATLAQATIPGADEVSVTLLDGGSATTVAFTGDLAFRLDERQYEDGWGPCTDAARTGATIPLFDLEAERRYPGFVSAARRAGVVATLSIALPVRSRVGGALNVYARRDGSPVPLDEASVPVGEAFAAQAAVAVANAALLERTQRLADQMREAMATRAVIEQAKGVLVATTGCTPEEAFATLVRRSRTRGRKVARIAAEAVAQAQGGPPPDDSSD